LLESELLHLKRENFVDPFCETFLFGKREGEEGRSDDIPMDGIEGRGKGPFVMFAEVDVLSLTCIEASDLRGNVVSEGGSRDGQGDLAGG
jgi:hypothetical protein